MGIDGARDVGVRAPDYLYLSVTGDGIAVDDFDFRRAGHPPVAVPIIGAGRKLGVRVGPLGDRAVMEFFLDGFGPDVVVRTAVSHRKRNLCSRNKLDRGGE